jgi:hypothetical protein
MVKGLEHFGAQSPVLQTLRLASRELRLLKTDPPAAA